MTLICFMIIGLVMELMTGSVLGWLGAPDSVKNALASVTHLYVLLIGTAGTATSALVVVLLTFSDILDISSLFPRTKDGDADPK